MKVLLNILKMKVVLIINEDTHWYEIDLLGNKYQYKYMKGLHNLMLVKLFIKRISKIMPFTTMNNILWAITPCNNKLVKLSPLM